MIQGYYTASNAMLAQQQRINAISGNIANIGTSGYKRTDVDFSGVLNSVFLNGEDEEDGAYQIGNGIVASQTLKDFSQGVLNITNEALDLSIDGEGFFTLGDGNGQTFYSRGGSFHLSLEGDSCYIVSSEGYYLLDSNMNKIEANDDVTILGGGTVLVNGAPTTTIRIVNVTNPDSLDQVGNGLYQITDEAGGETAEGLGRVVQGSLEESNVDLATEMTELIKVQRIYQINSRLVRTIDEMQGMANGLRK